MKRDDNVGVTGMSIKKKLSTKQKLFARAYVTNKGNGTEAAAQVYNVSNRNVARSIGSENLTKPVVLAEIKKWEELLDEQIVPSLLTVIDLRDHDPSPHIRLAAAKDLLDRAVAEKQRPTGRLTMNILTNMSDEELHRRIRELGGLTGLGETQG